MKTASKLYLETKNKLLTEFPINYPELYEQVSKTINDAVNSYKFNCSLNLGKDKYDDYSRHLLYMYLKLLGYTYELTCTSTSQTVIKISWEM